MPYHEKAEPLYAESLRGQKHDPRELLALAGEATSPGALPYGHPGRKAEEVPA